MTHFLLPTEGERIWMDDKSLGTIARCYGVEIKTVPKPSVVFLVLDDVEENLYEVSEVDGGYSHESTVWSWGAEYTLSENALMHALAVSRWAREGR